MNLSVKTLLQQAQAHEISTFLATAAKPKAPKATPAARRTMAGFMREMLKATAEDGVTGKYTYREIYEAAKVEFPEWNSLGREHYPQWYALEARRKNLFTCPPRPSVKK